VFSFEFVLRRHRVGGNTQDAGTGFSECSFEPIEVDRFFGATGRVGAGIKIVNELAPGKMSKGDRSTAVARECKCRRLGAGLDFAGHNAFLSTLSQGHPGSTTRMGELG